MTDQAGVHELLAAERASTLERLSGLEREFSGTWDTDSRRFGSL